MPGRIVYIQENASIVMQARCPSTDGQDGVVVDGSAAQPHHHPALPRRSSAVFISQDGDVDGRRASHT